MNTDAPGCSRPDTKTSLLDAAERVFASKGIDGASLRAITREADVNLASVHYHFGSKEGLVRAVLARRLRPLNRQRLELLDRCLEGGDPPQLEHILQAFIDPVFALMDPASEGRIEFLKVMSRALGEPDDTVRSILIDEFEEVFRRFSQALTRVLPHLSPAEIAWRFHFMIGSMAHTFTAGQLAREKLRLLGRADAIPSQGAARHLIGFLAAGWRAPANSDIACQDKG